MYVIEMAAPTCNSEQTCTCEKNKVEQMLNSTKPKCCRFLLVKYNSLVIVNVTMVSPLIKKPLNM